MASDVSSLRTRIYLLAFVDEFVPFVVLFTLWFDDNGVSISQLSAVFVLWAIAALVFEIPSGALADRVDRRHLLAAAFSLRIVGIAVWLISPTFAGLMVGGALWAIHDSFASGAWEAAIHDQLEAVDDATSYGIVIARVGQFSHGGTAVAALLSTPLLGAGLGLQAVGWISMVVQFATILIVVSLPDVRWVVDRARAAAHHEATATSTDAKRSRGPLATLARQPGVGALVVVSAVVGGLAIIDEYVPLLARGRGLDDALNPLVYLVVWIGLIVGGEIAARQPTLSFGALGMFVVAGCVAAFAGLRGDSAWLLITLGPLYAAIEATWVIGDAQLQAQVPHHIRATVTSVREFGAGGVAGLAFAFIALMTDGDDPTPGLLPVVFALGIAGLAVAGLGRRRAGSQRAMI